MIPELFGLVILIHKHLLSNKPVIIIFPPVAFPERPVLSLAALAGFLRNRGVKVRLEDYNIESYHFLLDPGRVDLYAQRIEKNLLDPAVPDDWKLKTAETLAQRRFIKENLGRAKKILQDKSDYYDPAKRTWALHALGLGRKLVSAAYYPMWEWGGGGGGYNPGRSADILAASRNPAGTPFNDLFEKKIKARIVPERPLLIGISICYPDQVIPAFRLLGIIKDYLPGVHTTVGGAVFTRLAEEIPRVKALFSLCDSFVINEGETALWSLYQALLGEKPLSEVPNLIYKEGDHIHTNRSLLEKVEELPAPSFDGLPLEQYFSPEIVLHLETSRGCYWRKCTFCNLPKIQLERSHRPFPPGKLAERIEKLCRRYKTRWVTFWDEAVPPSTLRALSAGLLEKKVSVQWQAEIMFDTSIDRPLLELMARAGCRGLFFGLESASERIQKLMGKRIEPDRFLKLLKNCRELDIHVNIAWFVGFPGETREEAETTYNFLIDNCENEYAWNPGSFVLRKHSFIERYPERFGVEVIRDPADDLAIDFPYRPRSGLSQKEALELRSEFLERFNAKGLALELRYGSAYLLYQSHYGKGRPDFYPSSAEPQLMEHVKSQAIPVLAGNLINENIKLFHKGRYAAISVLIQPKTDSVVIRGRSGKIDFWLEKIDGLKTIGRIKQEFQRNFGSRSPWLAPYLKLVEQGFVEIEVTGPYPPRPGDPSENTKQVLPGGLEESRY